VWRREPDGDGRQERVRVRSVYLLSRSEIRLHHALDDLHLVRHLLGELLGQEPELAPKQFSARERLRRRKTPEQVKRLVAAAEDVRMRHALRERLELLELTLRGEQRKA